MLSNISDDNVMQLEETDVHKVQQHSVPCLVSFSTCIMSLTVCMHGATSAATNTVQFCPLTPQFSLHWQRSKRSFKETYKCTLQVWEDVLQQMPARAEIVSQLGQSAEVQIHYSVSRLMADMFVCHTSDHASDMTTSLCCVACLLGVNAQSSSTRRGLFPLGNMGLHAQPCKCGTCACSET